MKMKKFTWVSIFLSGYWLVASGLEDPTERILATCPAKSIADSTGKYCCPASCGQCGGSGCDKRPGGAGSCCTSKISKSCNVSGAPCIASANPKPTGKCPAGSIADSSGKVCCPAKCGACGGSKCNAYPGGAANCCTSQIKKSCSSSVPPCILSSTSNPTDPPTTKCPAGGLLDSTRKACCPASCGTCGGSGCDKRPGGTSACCTSQIKNSCTTGKLPCLVSITTVPTDPPVPAGGCPTGSIADGSKKACCPASCGVCGGPGCDKHPGGASKCCTSQIKASCSTGILPCLQNTTSDGYCSNGMEGYEATFEPGDSNLYNYCSISVCCPKSCGTCDTSVDCKLADECCARNTAQGLGVDTDVSCRTHDPPCVVPYPDDKCIPNPCQNGARCGIDYGHDEVNCLQQQICECEELGNYSGLKCELKCGVEETPCGYAPSEYVGSSYFKTNDVCCTAKEECLKVVGKNSYSNQCFAYDRPQSCSPKYNPCLNGGYCDVINYYDPNPPIYVCYCLAGYKGAYCEIKV